MSMLRRFIILTGSFYVSILQAATLGHVVIHDSTLGSRTLTYEQKGAYAVVEGDIIIGKIKDLNQPGAIVKTKIGGSRWPEGIIPFKIAENMPFHNKLAILQAMDYWQKNTHLEFIELNSTNRSAYPDYISFITAEGTTCSSSIGRIGGEQEINLAPRCNTMITVHEIGHALGLWHEQSRFDRNQYIRIIWENIEEDYRHNFEQPLTDGKDYGDYDYDSIMHYGMHAFSKNGEKTIIPLQEGVNIGQRTHLSVKDIAAVNAMYPGL